MVHNMDISVILSALYGNRIHNERFGLFCSSCLMFESVWGQNKSLLSVNT